MWNGPAFLLIAFTAFLILTLSLIYARQDTIREIREFFRLRKSRSALLPLFMLLAVGMLGGGIGYLLERHVLGFTIWGGLTVFFAAIVWLAYLFLHECWLKEKRIYRSHYVHKSECVDPESVNIDTTR